MKKFMNEFKQFAVRGNMLDMAIGVIIGGAFTGIVTSLTDNFINPILNLVTGGQVYTLKDVSITSSPWGLPEIISLTYIAIIQIIKRNNLISMISGTILYMFLVQVVF